MEVRGRKGLEIGGKEGKGRDGAEGDRG